MTGTCRACGAKASGSCKCGAKYCASHSWKYVDEANAAISKNAPTVCTNCAPVKFPRPFNYVRAIERGEVAA
jgi:hypothetical protein